MGGVRRPVTAAIFTALFVLFVIFISPKIVQIGALKKRSQALERDIAALKLQNRALENELRLLRDDPVYVEKVAREKFNKAKEGEIVYKVVREENTKPVSR